MHFASILLIRSFSIYVAAVVGILAFIVGFVLNSSIAVKEKGQSKKLRKQVEADKERVDQLRKDYDQLNPNAGFDSELDD